MNVFARSWKLAKLSFGVIWKDKEILAYPIVGGILGIVLVGAILVLRLFNIIVSAFQGGAGAFQFIDILLVVIAYFGLVMITVFTEACVVYTADKRLRGGNATFFESVGAALGKAPALIGWGIITGTVGLLLKILEKSVEKAKGVGKVLVLIITSILGMAWTVLTAFAVQGIMINAKGPFDSIKESMFLLKKTWGERLIRQFGFGAVMFIFALVGAVILVPLFILAFSVSDVLGVGIIVLAIFYFFVLMLVFEIAEDVYMTALYIYATTGKTPEGFDQETMSGAFNREDAGKI